jgi:uncharacterized NAD-dependent epimerase/dehydratase family protein
MSSTFAILPSNVIVLNPPEPSTVLQRDLEELLLLSRVFSEARHEWERKRAYIREALRAGARVESGVHDARLESSPRPDYYVAAQTVERLVVR